MPSILELADRLGGMEGIFGVNVSLWEIDANTHSIKVASEGGDTSYKKVEETRMNCGASIHLIGGVSAEIKIVEEMNTHQDRW